MSALPPSQVPTDYQDLGDELRRRFVPAAAMGFDHLIDLDTGQEPLIRLRIRNQQLALNFADLSTAQPRADVRFYFPNLAIGRALLLGEADAIDAFMKGEFRSDGHLMLSFALMAMFNSTSLPPTPND